MKAEPLTDAEMNMSVEEWATALMEDPSCMRTYLLAAEARGRTLAQQEARAERDREWASYVTLLRCDQCDRTFNQAPRRQRCAACAPLRALLEGK